MRWTKLGKIFDPSTQALANGCRAYAQSPQALILKDRVRFYFSTRSKDHTGKFLSHIAYVDMDKGFDKTIAVSSHVVISLGGRGCFDEHGIFPMNVLCRDHQVWAYTCGWSRRVSVSVETGIGFACSDDLGESFRKLGDGPIMSSTLHEPFLVGDPFVQVFDNKFHMWYIFGTEWRVFERGMPPDRIYKIGYAVSEDGLSWHREGRPIITEVFPEESQALPTVARIGDGYHMFFCYRRSSDFRANRDRSYRIGYAYSDDLREWVRDDIRGGLSVSESGWDCDMMCYPHIFHCDGRVYLAYNGNEFGREGFGLARLEEV